MGIGILSDIHNNLKNVDIYTLANFQGGQIQALVHRGNLTGAEIAQSLAGFQVICVLENIVLFGLFFSLRCL